MPEDDDRVDEMLDLLEKESERGCVLVAAAYIESALRRALSAYCRTISEVTETELNQLFKTFDSQFANFAPCIRLARALGIITAAYQESLKKFGAWRNPYAHGTGEKPIVLEEIASFANEGLEAVGIIKEGGTYNYSEDSEFSAGRSAFMIWAALVVEFFEEKIEELEQTSMPPRSPYAIK